MTAVPDTQKQEDYKAEVKIYQALDNLKGENSVAIHSLKCTHFQYALWDFNHNQKECSKCINRKSSDEGELDFVVLGPDYIVLIEVKNAVKSESISSFTEKAAKQMDKITQVIKRIAVESVPAETSDLEADTNQSSLESKARSQTKIKPFKVFRFMAFPNYHNISNNTKFVEEQQSDIQFILLDDLGEFENWWQQNVTEKKDSVSVSEQDPAGEFQKVKHVLWMLWATNGDTLDSSSIGLRSGISETDKRLRASKITVESSNKERLPNSNVVKTERLQSAKINNTNILNNILGIKYITKKPAGSFRKGISTVSHYWMCGFWKKFDASSEVLAPSVDKY